MLNLTKFMKANPLFYCCAFTILINYAALGVGVYAVGSHVADIDLVAEIEVGEICTVKSKPDGIKWGSFRGLCKEMLRTVSEAKKQSLDKTAFRGFLVTVISMVLLILLVVFRRKE